MERQYQLFRRESPGSQPEAWAISNDTEDGCLLVRTGSAGKLDQHSLVPSEQPHRDRLKAIKRQEDLGYQYIGLFGIHPGGCPFRQENALHLLQDETVLYWELNSPPGAARYSDLIQSCFEDTARILQSLGLSSIEDNLIQIHDWHLAITATTMEGINHLCTKLGEGSGLIPLYKENSAWSLLPVLFLQAATNRYPEVFSLTFANHDGSQLPFDLKPGSSLLQWASANQQEIRPVAEALGLLEAQVDLSTISPSTTNYYF